MYLTLEAGSFPEEYAEQKRQVDDLKNMAYRYAGNISLILEGSSTFNVACFARFAMAHDILSIYADSLYRRRVYLHGFPLKLPNY